MSNEGTFDKAKGRVKQAAGDLTDNERLRREGQVDEQAGKAKEAIGKVKDGLEDAVDTVKDKVQRNS